MILETTSKTETNCNITGSTFSIKASPLAFDILSSKLYADPVLAIVRELLTNAYDSQKAAGNEDTPIKVHLPDYEENFLSFRDYGLGLSKEDVLTIYTSFFNSTKSSNNDYTGCFGLGSKTPFSYTSSFSVNSYFNGIKYYYLAIKKDGSPNIYCIKEESTDEPNGLEIIIPLKEEDKYSNKFSKAINKYLSFIPEIKVDCNKDINKPEFYGNINNIYFYDRIPNNSKLYIKQGQNVYEVVISDYINQTNYYVTTVIDVPIGTLGITPSRESLSKEESNRTKIENIIYKATKDISNYVLNNYNSNDKIINNCLSTFLVNALNIKYFNTKRYIDTINSDNIVINLLDNLTYKKINNNSNYFNYQLCLNKNKESLFILTNPNNIKKVNKIIEKIVYNYPELEDKDIYVITHNNFIKLDKPQPSVFKCLYDFMFILNSIDILNVNCSIIGFTKFHRLYPNSKIPRKKRNTEINLDDIFINYSYHCINNCNIYSYSDLNSITNIKNKYTPKNTVVFIKQDNDNYYNIINSIKDIYNITKDTHNFMNDYFNNLGLDINNNIYFLKVGKTRLKYFKDYIQINPEEVLEYALNADWKVLCSENTEYTIEDIEEFIKHSYNKKAQKVIFNSRIIKKLKRIAEYKNKFINKSINISCLKSLKNDLNNEQYNKLLKHFVNTNANLTKLINNDKQLNKFILWFTCNSKGYKKIYQIYIKNNPRTSKYVMNSEEQKKIFNYI